ncbi:MAG: DNA/RNA non-specific endonuclease, partial [Ferruginibacter sp.]
QKLKLNQGDYTGYVVNGMPNGLGKLIFKDSSKYDGNWKDGLWEEYGVFTNKKGDTIDGDWSKGKLDGEASVISKFLEYEGGYVNGKKDGYGAIVFSNGTLYSGDWKGDEMSGFGELITTEGVVYDGEWLNGVPNGVGQYTYLDIEEYEGEWEDGRPKGTGVFNCEDYTYEGSFTNGLLNGFGEINYKKTKDKYNGYFKEGIKDSIGEYTFNSGNNYKGTFEKDQFNGIGIFTYKDGSNYQGDFYEGLFYGAGTLTLKQPEGDVTITGNWNGNSEFPEVGSMLFANGDLYEGPLVNGKPTEKGLWSSEEERIAIERNEQLKKDNRSLSERSFDFYKKNKETINNVLDKTTMILDVVEVVALAATASGVLAPIAGPIFIVVKGVNIAAHSAKVGLSSLEVVEALGGGEKGKKLLSGLTKFILEIKKTAPELYESLTNLENINSDQLISDFKKFAIANGIDEASLNAIDQETLVATLKTLAVDTAMLALSAMPGSKLGKSIGKSFSAGGKIIYKAAKSKKALKPLFKTGEAFQKKIMVDLSKGTTKTIAKTGSKSSIKGNENFLKNAISKSSKNGLQTKSKLKNNRALSNKLNNIKPSGKGSGRSRKNKNKDGLPFKLVNWKNNQLKIGKKFTLLKNKRSISIKMNGETKARAYSAGSKIVISVAGHFDGDRKINTVILGPLVRKATYKVNSAIYTTDNKSRPKKAVLPIITKGMFLGSVDRNTITGATESEIAIEHHRISGQVDDGGHLIAHTLGGVKANINIVPQYYKMNRGPFKIVESFIKENQFHIKKYNVEVHYDVSSTTFRPNDFYQSFYFYGDIEKIKNLQRKLLGKNQSLKFIEISKGIYKCILGTSNEPSEILENTVLNIAA